jgi:hypothetical protein
VVLLGCADRSLSCLQKNVGYLCLQLCSSCLLLPASCGQYGDGGGGVNLELLQVECGTQVLLL